MNNEYARLLAIKAFAMQWREARINAILLCNKETFEALADAEDNLNKILGAELDSTSSDGPRGGTEQLHQSKKREITHDSK